MSGTGKGGKSFQDRELAAKVRTKALNDIYLILNDDPAVNSWSELKKQTLTKMSTSLLPRLNEHTGDSGEPMKILFDKTFDGTPPETEADSSG